MAPVVLVVVVVVVVVVVGAVKVRCASSQQTHFMSKSSSLQPARRQPGPALTLAWQNQDYTGGNVFRL